MKKKLLLVFFALLTVSVFARGNDDRNGRYYDDCSDCDLDNITPGYGRGPGRAVWTDKEGNPVTPRELSFEGTLVLEEGTFPYLNSSEGKVFLMVPPFALEQVELKGSENVKVTGYDMPMRRWDEESKAVYLHVIKAEVDGEEYTLDQNAPGRRDLQRDAAPGNRGDRSRGSRKGGGRKGW